MRKTPRKINPELPATAISFDKDTLELLRLIAENEDRSLASLIRRVMDAWLESAEGQESALKAKDFSTRKTKWADHPAIAAGLVTGRRSLLERGPKEVAETPEDLLSNNIKMDDNEPKPENTRSFLSADTTETAEPTVSVEERLARLEAAVKTKEAKA